MAYQSMSRGNNKGYQAQGKFSNGGNGGASEGPRPILTKLMKPSKSGKAVATFTVGDSDLVIPSNSRVSVIALSAERQEALAKASKDKGYTSAVPTHELIVFAIEK